MTPGALLAEVTRRDVVSGDEYVESIHTGHLVVTGGDGEVLAAIGDPDTPLFVRSTVKPLQATTCLELLEASAAEPTDVEVAVAWSSHRGEPRHVEAVRRLLSRSGTDPEQLTCPPAVPPADRTVEPARIWHNCSGKHAMFALAGARLDVTRATLLEPTAPLQRVVLADLATALGSVSGVGVDGCGAPAVRAPIVGLARAFARIAIDDRYRRVRDAGLRHPGLVGGEGRLESALLAAGVVAKVGAEGSYAVGWSAADGSPRGLAARAADGSVRGSAVAVVALLVAAGVVPVGTWDPPPPLGGGEPAGHVRAADEVVRLGEALAAG